MCEPLEGRAPHERLRPIARALARRGVQPFALVEVEHCCRCEEHSMSTKHVPGLYALKFEQLKWTLERRFKHCLVVATPADHLDRLGAFEVRLALYAHEGSQDVYSKLRSGSFPKANDVAKSLAHLLAQRRVCVPSSRAATTTRTPVQVTVLCTEPSLLLFRKKQQRDSEKKNASCTHQVTVVEKVFVVLLRAAEGGCASRAHDGRARPKASSSLEMMMIHDTGRSVSPVRRDATLQRARSHRRLAQTTCVATTTTAVQLLPGYRQVIAWGKLDVERWLTAHRLCAQDAKDLMQSFGLNKGCDLLRLTDEALKLYGVIKLVRRAMLESLQQLRTADSIVPRGGEVLPCEEEATQPRALYSRKEELLLESESLKGLPPKHTRVWERVSEPRETDANGHVSFVLEKAGTYVAANYCPRRRRKLVDQEEEEEEDHHSDRREPSSRLLKTRKKLKDTLKEAAPGGEEEEESEEEESEESEDLEEETTTGLLEEDSPLCFEGGTDRSQTRSHRFFAATSVSIRVEDSATQCSKVCVSLELEPLFERWLFQLTRVRDETTSQDFLLEQGDSPPPPLNTTNKTKGSLGGVLLVLVPQSRRCRVFARTDEDGSCELTLPRDRYLATAGWQRLVQGDLVDRDDNARCCCSLDWALAVGQAARHERHAAERLTRFGRRAVCDKRRNKATTRIQRCERKRQATVTHKTHLESPRIYINSGGILS